MNSRGGITRLNAFVPAAAGAMVMAGGIALLDALQRLPFSVSALSVAFTILLLAIGAFIAFGFVRALRDRTFHRYTDVPIESFAIGTWVAGMSILAQAVLLSFTGWRALALALGVVAFALWIWFLSIVARGFTALLRGSMDQRVTGRILLSTVATQSVALLSVALFPGQVPHAVLAALIVLGYLLYVIGLTLVAERYLRRTGWNLADDWDNTNCILHGAVSITGLAGIVTGVLPDPWINATWLWAAGMFVVVEVIELDRARARVRRYGWKKGVFTYSVSQWARNFTFGMFYAFTLHLSTSTGHTLPFIISLRNPIVTYCQYVVLGLLVFETGLFVRDHAAT